MGPIFGLRPRAPVRVAGEPPAVAIVAANVERAARIGYRLSLAGMAPQLLGDGEDLDGCIARTGAQMVVIEAGLPGEHELSLVRQFTGLVQLHVVLLTNDPSLAARLDGYAAGASVVLGPPIELEELVAILAGIARRHKLARVVQEPHADATMAQTLQRRSHPRI